MNVAPDSLDPNTSSVCSSSSSAPYTNVVGTGKQTSIALEHSNKPLTSSSVHVKDLPSSPLVGIVTSLPNCGQLLLFQGLQRQENATGRHSRRHLFRAAAGTRTRGLSPHTHSVYVGISLHHQWTATPPIASSSSIIWV